MERNITVDPKDAQDNKIMGILAYLNLLVLVPIFAAKESPFAKFHANQGLILVIAHFALWIVFYIFGRILLFISLGLWFFTSLLSGLVSLGILVFAIIGIINVVNGEMKELPIIGKFKILK